MATQSQPRIVGSPPAMVRRVAVAATALLLLCVLPSAVVAVEDETSTLKLYNLFRSYSCDTCSQQQQMDGLSGIGTLFAATGGTAGVLDSSLLVCDSGGGGSTVRTVNRSGIHTIAGNLVARGMKDGPANEALFNSPSAIVMVDGVIYVTDTNNDRIRKIAPNGEVTTFLSSPDVSKPKSIMPYRRPQGTYDLFVADTGNNRIIFAPLTANPFTTVFSSGLQAGAIQIDDNRGIMFTTQSSSKIIAIEMGTGIGSSHSWEIGRVSCLGYISSLMLTDDGKELLYYGNIDGVNAIMAISAIESEANSPSLCPRVVMKWEGNDIVFLAKSNSYQFYVGTSSNVYILQNGTYTVTPTVQPVTKTPSLEVSYSPSLVPDTTVTVSISISLNESFVVAAFFTDALPVGDVALMHELYSWIMKDVSIAFNTNNFFTVFQPSSSPHVPGSVNVSTWRNLTALYSYDSRILIMEFISPDDVTVSDAQRLLFVSEWYWTRKFLGQVNKTEYDFKLGPFCMIHCVENCVEIDFASARCVDPTWFTGPCDSICVGAIVSSLVLGVTGAGLIALMVFSSSNLRNAFVRLPAF